MNRKEEIEKNLNLDIMSKVILILSALVIGFSFFSPWLLTLPANWDLDFSNSGQVGDTIGGIMNPFIALSGVLLTFLAFFIQFKANRVQYSQFRLELDEQKLQAEKDKIESQFYEMLRLHKENVNEIRIVLTKTRYDSTGPVYSEQLISGRFLFDLLKSEFEICYFIAKEHFPEASQKELVNEAYGVFFLGLNQELVSKHEYFKVLQKIQKAHSDNEFHGVTAVIHHYSKVRNKYYLEYDLFKGHSSQLAHYYRHLFQTVKFIVNQSDRLLTYEDKRGYLRILRSQLSNQEQAMLFYNWLSKFGHQWENEINHFFTDYRMIHNLYDAMLVPEIKLNERKEFKRDFLTEKGRSQDPLFEYEDWN
ncbi:MAG: hypothetical protein CMC96_03715 [Flavobacteriales bacterium]|nr:hypothetical protein [Flavobacteriales bacterium]|tara:strand:- start:11549 stop:12637 length:1089 start_codon:yes stop_codon:yes gene_type:complete